MNEYSLDLSAFLERAQTQQLEQLSNEEFWDYARTLAQTVPAAAQPAEYLECLLHQGQCLIPLAALYEVVPPPHSFALLPAMPKWMMGVLAWQGETIAGIDLGAYLADASTYLSPRQGSLHEGILLIVKHADVPLGLLVPAIGQTTMLLAEQRSSSTALPAWYSPSRAASIQSMQGDALVLHGATLLADMVQQLETAATYE